ncbi:hypothetical protein FMEAI12_4570003 [Parafrankia sp. Ea1.12]|nr:hypothetical protein FMEAI12_4570003 [Parafrankia sp. Ea1.12]
MTSAYADWDCPAASTCCGFRSPIATPPARTPRAAWVKMSKEYPSPGWLSEPYRAESVLTNPPAVALPPPVGVSAGPPMTPMRCAETPTHASPCRISSSCVLDHTTSESVPELTLSHSTTTVPLNLSAAGRRTSTRVVYGAVVPGWNVQRPSAPSAPRGSYDVAVPDAAYSVSTYPVPARSTFVGEPRPTPLPPLSSCNSAAGPAGRGGAVGVVSVAVFDVGPDPSEHADPNTATARKQTNAETCLSVENLRFLATFSNPNRFYGGHCCPGHQT